MRIFFAVPRSAWVDLNLRRSLEDMGHELVRFDFPGWPDEADLRWQHIGKPRTNERLVAKFRAALRQGRVDLFYGYFYSSVVYPETIDLIRQSGVPTVNFSCNNVHQFDLVRDIAAHFDICVVPELAAAADFKAVGAVPVRIQLAANPAVYRPYPEPRMYDATFVGQRYADRADFLCHLSDSGVDVRAWGAGWQSAKRLDAAHLKAALALVEDERLDGISRLIRHRLSRAPAARIASLAPSGDVDPGDGKARPEMVGPSGRPAPGTMDLSGRPAPGTMDLSGRPAPGIVDPSVRTDPGIVVPHGSMAPEVVDTSRFGGPRLLQRELVKNFSQSRISLGFATAGASHLSGQRLRHLRLREFEAPMSGALYLTEDQPELGEYFEPGKEVLTYTDRHDLLDKVRYYLAHQEQAERIRHAGHGRARSAHTWQHRFRELFAVLGLPEHA